MRVQAFLLLGVVVVVVFVVVVVVVDKIGQWSRFTPMLN